MLQLEGGGWEITMWLFLENTICHVLQVHHDVPGVSKLVPSLP